MTALKKNKRPCSVLVCDDRPLMRRSLRRLLASNPGFRIAGEAVNGRQAVTMALELKPDLVLMDVHMPGLNGDEATRHIVLAAPRIKVLAYSASADWWTVDRMLAAGAAGYVVKGSDPEELFQAARTVLAGGLYLSASLLGRTLGTTGNN